MKKWKMYRQPKVKGRKLGLKTMVGTRRKKETFNHNRMKKQEFKKKMRRCLGTSGTSLNILTSESYRCQKEENKIKKLKIYLKT